ncbi:MAG: tRNA-dihydrouridine synthase [Helicobacter sp.]|uniref:tRNA dihydrouridine synthase n=1 Tax=Helicobacter sp. TaxID=218 RepID=UPI0023D0E14D|nr:tRNA-dihydrouridine synthase [Helicobacter sp.]MDE5925699.1 tRNA-dihydrouridine synthase [Helicobacter sp.]MDE7174505.1 tRNA-dihydrouridine synthase [Helicobacter sp.]
MLAPLAGYTDLPFREVVKKFGADITVSEMISVHALAFKNKKTLKMVEKSPIENPFALQIAGNEMGIITRAVESLNAFKENIQILDLNCGCPAPKVSNHGSGSSLLKDLNKLREILKLIRKVSEIPYLSVKVRLGFDTKIPLEIANALNDTPIDYVVVHGRTKADGYKKERIDYDSIALMKRILRVPLIANGEINSVQKSQEVLRYTGADGIMIGRAAVEKPWIFAQIKEGLQEESVHLRQRVSLEHFDRTIAFRGDYGAIMFRKNLHAYSKGLKGASEFRTLVNTITDSTQMRQAILEFFSSTTFET